MPKLLSILSPLLALAGCGNCVPIDLTPDERAWVSAYQPGQRLTFRSNRGATNVLTMQPLKEWHDNENCNWLESGNYQPIRSTLILTSAAAYGSSNPSFSVLAYKTSPDHPVQLTFDLAGLLCQATDPPGGPNPRLVKLTPATITLSGGRSYPAAQLLRSGQLGTIHLGSSQMRAAWWDQHAGLLRYELASGEVFDLATE
jgi:hypothetical protein